MNRFRLIPLLLVFAAPLHLAAEEPATDILIDKVHANDYSDIGLIPGEYDYHKVFGFKIAFDYLRHRGIRMAEHAEGRLDAATLRGHRLLFINLVSAERPPFYVSEIRAIVDFVRNGGSLFIITEHSNAYFHAWRLAPLLDELGIESPTDTACDVAPHTLGSGNGWILIERFDEHPINEGLRRIAFQTGGRVDDRFAIAWTSPDSWADAWQTGTYGEKHGMGFFGNWKKDEGERSGPLGVVLAKEFGKGRIAMIAEQNMFSDVYIDYADNYKIWINTIAWLLRQEPSTRRDADETSIKPSGLSDPAEYRAFRKPTILFAEDFKLGHFGTDDRHGCYHLMSILRRKYATFADDRYEYPYELVVLPNGYAAMNDSIIDILVEHLRRGKSVLAPHTGPDVVEHADSILKRAFQKAGVENPEFEKMNDIVFVARSNGIGNVYLFAPELPLINGVLPNPSTKPSIWQKYRVDVFEQQLKLILEAEKE